MELNFESTYQDNEKRPINLCNNALHNKTLFKFLTTQ